MDIHFYYIMTSQLQTFSIFFSYPVLLRMTLEPLVGSPVLKLRLNPLRPIYESESLYQYYPHDRHQLDALLPKI